MLKQAKLEIYSTPTRSKHVFVLNDGDFENIPEDLIKDKGLYKKINKSITVSVNDKSRIGGLNPKEVLDNIEKQGYHIESNVISFDEK